MKKSLISAAILASLGSLGLTGCFSSSSSSNTVSSTAVAVDWYVKDALVFADLNENGVYDSGDIKATAGTGLIPQYTLSFPDSLVGTKVVMIVKGGTDVATNQPYNGVMKARATVQGDGTAYISPLTSVYEDLRYWGIQDGLSDVEAETAASDRLNVFFGVSLPSFNINPIADKNSFIASQQTNTLLSSLSTAISKVTDGLTADGTQAEQLQNYSSITNDFARTLYNDSTLTNSTKQYVTDTVKTVVDRLIPDTASTANNNLTSDLTNTLDDVVYNAVNTVASDLVDYVPTTSADAPADVVSAQTTATTAADAADNEVDDAYTGTVEATIELDDPTDELSGVSSVSGTTSVQ